jgi:hypothetical protein
MPRTYDATSYEHAMTIISDATANTGQPCLTLRAVHKPTGQNCILCFLPRDEIEAVVWLAIDPPDDREPDAVIFYPPETPANELN